MKKRYIHATVFIIIVLLTAFGGLRLGQSFFHHHTEQNISGNTWHRFLHEQLHITAEQDKKLEDIERRHALRHKALEKEILLGNQALAEAIKTDKSYTPRVDVAVNKINNSMKELQKETLEHLFEMKPVLNEEQNRMLEQMIIDALYENK